MKINKIFNNNVVFSYDNGHEVVITGRGIGYNKDTGDEIDTGKIEKVYSLSNGTTEKFYEMLSQIPLEYVELCNEIINDAKLSIGRKINDGILLSLTDHIYFAIKRYNENIIVNNALLSEIKWLYSEEYQIGEKALVKMAEKFSVSLPDDEAGFIALHLVNAQLDEEIPIIVSMTKVMKSILDIVKEHFGVELNQDSLNYHRFTTHVKFFAQRIVTAKHFTGEQDKDLFSMVKSKYKESYQCAKDIKKFIKKKYDFNISDEELFYLTIHIKRITDNIVKKI